ncbi:MAG: hypothetical protein MK179_09525, partial [Pirellulaceae bacterium]|nr:hypothetical protein [Pirellulaceae bacterium]
MTRLTRFFVLSYVSAAWITLPAILTLTIPVVQAQEEAATEEASTEEASTDEASTDEASTDEASTEESSAEDAAPEITETNVPPFADVFEQWKTLLGKLREVRQEFDDAEDDALSEIAERHRALVV